MPAHMHVVHFSENDVSLINALSPFIGAGLRAGDVCIVVATRSHRKRLERQLQVDGIDVAVARARGSYVSLDAAATLKRLLIDGQPEPARFANVVGRVVKQAAQGNSRVRIFGELVALLWAQGNHAAAVRLEDLWNELSHTQAFSLFCAYPMQHFIGSAYEAEFSRICQQHSLVVFPEGYSHLSDLDRQRAFALLQQKARSLEIEVAKRKAAEARQRMLAAIVKSSDDAILSNDLDGIITSWNDAAERIYGYGEQEMIGQSVTRLFPPDRLEEYEQIMKRIHRGERVDRCETRRVCKDGTILTVSITFSPFKDDTGTIIGASAIARDITEQRRLEAESEQRKDAFISMANHELRTPLTTLRGLLSLVQRLLAQSDNMDNTTDSASSTNSKILHYLARMDIQIEKLITLVNDLLDVSRLQMDQLIYRDERIAMDTLVQDIVESIQETTQTHHLHIESQTRAEVFGDRDRLGQVLTNLLTNAIKYSPNADTVIVRLAADERQVLVSIQDFGRGIARMHHHKIFERFYRVNDPDEAAYPGLGIGLAICHDIVRRHGGRLWVESEKGKGATFHLSLPRFNEC